MLKVYPESFSYVLKAHKIIYCSLQSAEGGTWRQCPFAEHFGLVEPHFSRKPIMDLSVGPNDIESVALKGTTFSRLSAIGQISSWRAFNISATKKQER